MQQVIIDAAGKTPGRVATETVQTILGKRRSDYAPNRLADVSVVVTNAAAISLSPRKLRSAVHRRHSGAPGGFREIPISRLAASRPEEIIRHAIAGMLPKSRLRAQALRRVRILSGSPQSQVS